MNCGGARVVYGGATNLELAQCQFVCLKYGRISSCVGLALGKGTDRDVRCECDVT